MGWWDAADDGGPVQTALPRELPSGWSDADCANVLTQAISTASAAAAYIVANPATFGPCCAIAAAYLDGTMGAIAFLAAVLALGGPLDIIAIAGAIGVGAVLLYEFIQCQKR
jgi:hypothetical protein